MSRRVRVLPYKMGSKSSRALANYLGVKRLYNDGRSRFVGRSSDVIINWGSSSGISNGVNVEYINTPSSVALASNKLHTFKALEEAGVSIPEYFSNPRNIINGNTYVARTKLQGHSGDGIEVFTADVEQLNPYAPLYTKLIEKKYEYRAIVVGSEVVDVKKKLKKRDWEEENGERDPYVWNHSNGYVFARNDIEFPDSLNQLSVDATQALGLDFGAVDIIEDNEGNLYVLEINTAFGIEGTTLERVGEAIKSLL